MQPNRPSAFFDRLLGSRATATAGSDSWRHNEQNVHFTEWTARVGDGMETGNFDSVGKKI